MDNIDNIKIYEYDYTRRYEHVEGFLTETSTLDWFNWIYATKIKPPLAPEIQNLVGNTVYQVKTNLIWDQFHIELWFGAGFIFLGCLFGILGLFLEYSLLEICRMFKEEFSKEVNWYWWYGLVFTFMEIWMIFFIIALWAFSMYFIYQLILLPFVWYILQIPYHRWDNRVGYLFFPFWMMFWLPKIYRLYKNFNYIESFSQISYDKVRVTGFFISNKIKSDAKQKEIYFWENWKYNNNNNNTDCDYHIWMVEDGYTRFDAIIYDPGNYIPSTTFDESVVANGLSDIGTHGYVNYGEGFYITKYPSNIIVELILSYFTYFDVKPRNWTWAFVNQYYLHPIVHSNLDEDDETYSETLVNLLQKHIESDTINLRKDPIKTYTWLQSYYRRYLNKNFSVEEINEQENFVSFLGVKEFKDWLENTQERHYHIAMLLIAYWKTFNFIKLNGALLSAIKLRYSDWRVRFSKRVRDGVKYNSVQENWEQEDKWDKW